MSAGSTDALGFDKTGKRKLSLDEVWERYHKAYARWRSTAMTVDNLKSSVRHYRERVRELERALGKREMTLIAVKSHLKDALVRAGA